MDIMPRLLSLAHLTVLDADPLALIDAAAAGGFDAVGLRIVPPFVTETIVPVVGDSDLQRRIKQRLRGAGVTLLDIEAIWLKPDSNIEEIKPALETGAELGAKYVLTIAFDDDTARLTDNFGKLCAAAHGCGLRTMLEFIPYSVLGTLAKAHDFLVAAAPVNAGLLIDALHLSRSGGDPADIAAYDPTLFSYIHLCDAPKARPAPERNRDEARRNRLYPGDGELWLDAFLDAFPPNTPVAVEAPTAAFAHLPAAERARLAGEATRRLLRRRGE
jgi:sugar phosphate isomerase/epimerase